MANYMGKIKVLSSNVVFYERVKSPFDLYTRSSRVKIRVDPFSKPQNPTLGQEKWGFGFKFMATSAIGKGRGYKVHGAPRRTAPQTTMGQAGQAKEVCRSS